MNNRQYLRALKAAGTVTGISLLTLPIYAQTVEKNDEAAKTSFAFFFVDIGSVIKVLYFCSNLNSKALSIKLGDGAYARFAGNQIAPKGLLADTNRSNRANTGYYNSSFTQNYSPRS